METIGLQINITATLRSMKAGERAKFPISKLATVRSTASTMKAITGLNYQVFVDRDNGMVKVQCEDVERVS